MDDLASVADERERVLNRQSAQLFSTVHWIGPIGSAAAALTFSWVLQGLVNNARLQLWLIVALVAAITNAFAITIPFLVQWKTKRDVSVMSEVGHVAVGLTGGLLGFVDVEALAADRTVQMALTSYLFGMTLGVTLGLPTQGLLSKLTLVPIWLGSIVSLVAARQIVLVVAILTCGGLISYGVRQDRLMWTELITLRSAAKDEAARRLSESRTDLLTGLSNRAGSEAKLAKLITESSFDTTFAVLYLDLDKFKPINDRYGHASGDEVLAEIGHRIRAACRPVDVAARIGGDEFMVVLRHEPNEQTRPAALGQRIASRISEPITLTNGTEVSVTVSIGHAQGTALDNSIDHIVRNADSSMYELKSKTSEAIRQPSG